MEHATLNLIAPCFIVREIPQTLAYYREQLGFEVTHSAPDPDPFFAIVQRDGVMIFFKAIAPDVLPIPNSHRHQWARWDAYINAPDPDTLAAEFAGRSVTMSKPLADTTDGLRGFEIQDPNGYILFFGRPR